MFLIIVLLQLSAAPQCNAAEVNADWQRLVAAAKKEGKVVIGAPPGSDFRSRSAGGAEKALRSRQRIRSSARPELDE